MSEVIKKEESTIEEDVGVEEEPLLIGGDEEESFTLEEHESLSGVVIGRARSWGVFFEVEIPDVEPPSPARLCPLRSYVNGSLFLSQVCPHEHQLSLLFPPGSKFSLSVSRRLYSNKKTSGIPKESDWMVKRLWKGDIDKDDFKWSIQKEDAFLARSCKSTEDFLNPQSEGNQDLDEGPWFITTLSTPKYLPHPSIEGAIRNVRGTIASLLQPEGGIIQLLNNNQQVYFHRARVYSSSKPHLISGDTELKSLYKVGEEVRLDYIENKDKEGGSPLMEVEQKYIALTVYPKEGPLPIVPEVAFRKDSEEKYFIARILSLDEPQEKEGGDVVSGVAEILRPTERNTNGYVKSTFKKMVNLDPSVKKVKFHRQAMYHIGSPLVNADLQYFFSPYSYGLNIFFCYLRKLDEPEQEGDVTHEVSLGWKASTSFLHSTGRGALTIPPTVKEDTLLMIKSLSQCNTRFFGREGMDYVTYEKIIQGQNGPYAQYFNGNTDSAVNGYTPARISEVCFPPGKNEGVARGFCILQSGPHKGKRVEFTKNNFSIFGFKPNEKTDLQYFIVLNEPCFVRLEEEEGEELKVNDVWIGAPRSAFSQEVPEEEMAYSKFAETKVLRIKFFLFLESHDLTLRDFDEVIKGKKPPRKFLPLSRESNRGIVIQLERALSKGKGRRLDLGAVSGVIKVENGPLAGKYVTFHRKNTWVMGYNMLKADLTHIFQEGQKVNIEAEELPSKEASRGPVPYEYKYRATLVWTSKFRPRNDLDRTTPDDKRSHEWLKKRNLDSEKFQQLINGKLPIVNAQFAAKNGNNMLKYRDILELASGRVQPDGSVPPPVTPEQLPVLRHGPEAARICEAALSTTGPKDQRIMDIIRNDDNAQMAFHIHKALGFALEFYNNSNGSSSSSFSMNDSFGGGNSASNSSNNSGGGYHHHHHQRMLNGGGSGSNNSNNSYDNFQNFSQPSRSSNGGAVGGNNYGGYQQQQQQQQQQLSSQHQLHSNSNNYSNSSHSNNMNNTSGWNNGGGGSSSISNNSYSQFPPQQQQRGGGGGGGIYPLMGARGSSISSRGTKRQAANEVNLPGGYSPGMKKSRGVMMRPQGMRAPMGRPAGRGRGGGRGNYWN